MIKVAKLENIFGTNGSFEKPNTVPEISDFTEFGEILVEWNDNKTSGGCILEGDFNYAYCEGQGYFLKRLRVADREGAGHYGLVKDGGMNFIQLEVTVRGFCTRTSNKELLLDNLDYVEPVVKNPCKLYRLNLTDDVSRHGGEDLEEIKGPAISEDHFFHYELTDRDGGKFFKQIEFAPANDGEVSSLYENTEARYKKGVTIVGELKFEKSASNGKKNVISKLKPFLDKQSLSNYVLTKVTNLGETTVKNLYCLTLSNKAVGNFEETARVQRIDFSGLFDVVVKTKVQGANDETKTPFRKKTINKSTLDVTYGSEFIGDFKDKCRNYKVLQRKVYLPYLRKNGATNDDFLYRTHLTETEKSTARAQDTSIVSGYAETDPLVPIYQGGFAQGLKSKSKPNANFYLPYINQLDTTLNYQIKDYSTLQGQGNFNGKIQGFKEENPPEFGFLVFGEKRERKEWTGWHFRGEEKKEIEVIIGLKEGGDKPLASTNERNVDKGVKRVSQGWNNFSLLNSLYPYSGLYYFSAIRDNSLKISYHDGDKGGGTTQFFRTKPNKEGEENFALDELQTIISRDVDNNTLTLDNFDNRRNNYLNKNAITQKLTLPVYLYQNDIFFSDLTAFGEEYDSNTSNYKYATELGGYLDTKKNHRSLQKTYKNQQEGPKVVFYGNNFLKRYQIGIYYTYQGTHELAKKDNDIVRVKFRDNNSNTQRTLEAAPDGVESKTVLYHHITPIRITKSKQELILKRSTFDKQATIDYLKTQGSILKLVDNALKQIAVNRSQKSYSAALSSVLGVEHGKYLDNLPKKGDDGDYDRIYQILQVADEGGGYGESDYSDYRGPNYRHGGHHSLVEGWRGTYYGLGGIRGGGGLLGEALGIGALTGYGGKDEAQRQKGLDFIKFGDGTYTLCHTAATPHGKVQELKRLLIRLKRGAKNINDIIGDAYTFKTTQNFFSTVNNESFQKDFYSQLGLLDENNQFLQQEIPLKNTLFELKGTGYFLGIDNEEDAHLIFDTDRAKSDILLEEDKSFRLPHEEVPTQDYIDAINQQTSIQIATASYPLQERLLFKQQGGPVSTIEEDEYAENSFRLNIHRFSVEGKQNPNDYYIVEYQGARQLLDVKLGIPKRTVQQARVTDVVQMAQLAFEREKWREEFKNRQAIFEFQKQREFEEFQFRRERIGNQNTIAGVNMALGMVTGFGFNVGMSAVGGLLAEGVAQSQNLLTAEVLDNAKGGSKLTPHHHVMGGKSGQLRHFNLGKSLASSALGAVGSAFNSGMQLRELALQSRELDADIKQAIGLFSAQMNQLHTEHIFNERSFALQLMKVGNVFEQGEVNDRDINDQYNEKKGLKEVHLIYKVPSRVQREGLVRYYNLYGASCEIPDVTFKFSRVMRVGDIYQFSYIDTITNLGALEEKDILRTIFSNGFKILSLRKVTTPQDFPQIKAGATKAEELINEASQEQKTALFNKLTLGLDQAEIIKHLAENEADKNKLVEVITPYLDRASLLARLMESDDKGLKTKFVMKLLDKIDEDEVFNEILRNKDKEKLVEDWIDGGSKLLRVLGDKYPEHTVAKEVYVEELQKKDETIADYRQELQDGFQKQLSIQDQLGTANQELGETKQELGRQKELVTSTKQALTKAQEQNRKVQANLVSLQKDLADEKETTKDLKDKNSKLATQVREKETEVALQAAETLKVNTELKSVKEQLENYKQRETTLLKEKSEQNSKIESLEKEKVQLEAKVQECAKGEEAQEQLEECQNRPSGGIDNHKNVDFLITKDASDNVVVTTGNKQKGIGQQNENIVVKRNSTKRILRLAGKSEAYGTDQYAIGNYYRNNGGAEFSETVTKYTKLQEYLDGSSANQPTDKAKQADAGLGRSSIKLDMNIPYLNKDSEGSGSYGYHPTKGGFREEQEGAQEISSYEKYQEISKNLVTELQGTIEGLREIEEFKRENESSRGGANAIASLFASTNFYGGVSYVIYAQFSGSQVRNITGDEKALIFVSTLKAGEAKKIGTYRSKTPGAWRFTDDEYRSSVIRDEGLHGYNTNGTNNNWTSQSYYTVREALYVGKKNIIVQADYKFVPGITGTIDNNNYKTVKLFSAMGGDPDAREFTIHDQSSKGQKKLSTYLEYLDFLGLKGDESKSCAVPKSLLI